MNGYDNWKLSSGYDNEKVFSNCDHCDGEIYAGEDYYQIEDSLLHEDCLESYVKDHIAEHKTAI